MVPTHPARRCAGAVFLFVLSFVWAAEAGALCTALPRPAAPTALVVERIFPALTFSQPVNLLQAPGESTRWYVVEKTGRVMVFDEGATAASTFLDISALITTAGEQGLLDMAFHHNYPATPYIYLSYTDTAGDSVLARMAVAADGYTARQDTRTTLLQVEQPFANHNGGQLAFGPDDMLYLSLGDGGSGGDPQNNGQDPHTLLGAILRLDVDGGFPYAIPPDNPFAGSPCGQGGGCPEIYAWGLRNPWRMSFDQGRTQRLWTGDVGQSQWEEVDIIQNGGNYGWRCYEATHPYNLTGCSGTFDAPVLEYEHLNGRCSVTGGHVYRGADLRGLFGHYLYADYCTGEIWGLSEVNGAWTNTLLADTTLRIAAFGRGNDGEVYPLDIAGGGLYRLVDNQTAGQDFPALLSETGYFEAGAPVTPVSCFVPYAVNAELWSDGATKRRWVSAPAGSVSVGPDGDFDFPVGTVLIKEFSLNNTRLETRLFMRHEDGGWAGYSYRWRTDGTDADLLSGSDVLTAPGVQWYFPGPNDCMRCHTVAAGRTLGPEIGQLNGAYDYGGQVGVVNQLARWEALGLFAAPLDGPVAALAAYADPADTGAEMDDRARAYLHANCSGCHRPNGGARGNLDLRHATRLARTGGCNAPPLLGDMGLTDARLIPPGAPDSSVVLERMEVRGEGQMPPLASNMVDPLGASVVGQWIAGLRGCGATISPAVYLLGR